MTEADAMRALGGVVDPEIGLDIVELGLIYGVEAADGAVRVTMTLTTPGCPLHDVIVDGVERALARAGARTVDVDVVFGPPWSPGRIGADGLRRLAVTGGRRCERPGRRAVERQETVGGPPWQLPVALLGLAAAAQVAGAVAVLAAAPDLAAGIVYGPAQLGAAHLLGLAFLTVAILAALLQLVPVILRRPLSTPLRAAAAAGALAVGAWTLAGGLWEGRTAAIAAGGALILAGGAVMLADLAVALVGAARAGTCDATGAGIALSGLWLAAMLAFGGVMAANRVEPFLEVDRLRLIGAHTAVALVGWIGGTIVAVALRLAPMLALSHGHRRGPGVAAMALWHASVPPIAVGLGLGLAPLAAAGGGLLACAAALAGWFVADVARHRRRRLEAPLVHLAVGLASVAAACGLMLAGWAGAAAPARTAILAALLGLIGMGAGVTSGHLFKIVPMLVWTGRYARLAGTPGAPRLADLYPARLAVVEQVAFVAGLVTLTGGVAAGSTPAAAAGAGLLVVAALAVAWAVGVAALVRPAAARGAVSSLRAAGEPA